MDLGLSAIGLASKHWDIKPTIKAWHRGFGISVFAGDSWPKSFGTDKHLFQKLEKLLNSGKVGSLKMHGFWSYDHILVDKQTNKKEIQKWDAFTKPYQRHIPVFYSPSCEYQWMVFNRVPVKLEDITQRINQVRDLAPGIIPVCSASGGVVTVPGVTSEIHGSNARANPGQLVDYDGGTPGKGEGLVDHDAADYLEENKRARIVYGWDPRCNGAESHNKLTANLRTAFPGERDIRGWNRILLPKGLPPSVTIPGMKPLVAPWTWKSHAEDMQGKNPRDNRGLLIVKGKSRVAFACDIKGNVLAKLGVMSFDNPGAFPGGLTRYYVGAFGDRYSYELAEMALANTGSEYGYFMVDGKPVGLVHFAFRQGTFR